MENNKFEQWIQKLIEPTGIKINGKNAWDIQINNDDFYSRIKSQGSLGLGESYMEGWWDCKKLDELFYRILSEKLDVKVGLSLPLILSIAKSRIFNLQAIKRAFQVGEKHYDIGNDLFSLMLDKTMSYSCGYWKNAKNLYEAEIAKLDLICKKLNLQKGQRILDIGCGWGGLAYHAAKNYGVSVVGITVSKEQIKLAEEKCKGLPVEFRLQDYRDLKEKFDHIVSVGMFEHVGSKNYKTYFEVVKNCLADNGLFLLHTIGANVTKNGTDPWIEKYIFPNGQLPSIKQIAESSENNFIIEDLHNFGADYDKTLMAWYKNFIKAWPKLQAKYSEEFYRMWSYYLLACAGAFRARSIELWQIVLSPKGVKGGYKSIR